ncbi:tetratricopeptide repeat protein 1 isoform X2 [Rana temporaria]|uniref:tetratricopeptide repeat protein 1 isoform X2 n=1 Tax=Rana temporaria TaxID=8407 RepID=UPI001AACB21E|nr:tetratricopeptide repeat protein 1 isoform X2 [Rana temporaria]
MEKTQSQRSGKREEDEEEDFHDCTEDPERLNGESEEEFTVLEAEESAAEKPAVLDKGGPEPDKSKPEPVTREKGDPEPVMAEKRHAESVTEETGSPEPVIAEKGDPEPFTEEEENEEDFDPVLETEIGDAEMEEEVLQEMEKDMSEDEREDRRKESTRLKEEGNELFKKADYVEAENIYSEALQKCPAFYKKDRSILFSNRAAARLKQDKKELALTDCTKAIELNPDYVRALLRRAELYERTEKLDEALADYQSVINLDASCHQAREACMVN